MSRIFIIIFIFASFSLVLARRPRFRNERKGSRDSSDGSDSNEQLSNSPVSLWLDSCLANATSSQRIGVFVDLSMAQSTKDQRKIAEFVNKISLSIPQENVSSFFDRRIISLKFISFVCFK